MNPLRIRKKFLKIKVLAMDVDGVLTDGGIILGSGGNEYKSFNVQDGMGITLARMAGLKTAIITGRSSDSVTKRAGELKFDALFQGAKRKRDAFRKMKQQFGVSSEEVCYIGDDLLDLEVIRLAGVGVAVADARDYVKREADFVTKASGGRGAIREVVEKILKIQKKWQRTSSGF